MRSSIIKEINQYCLANKYRQYCSIFSIVQGMWKMLQKEEPEDFVLATGEVHSVREFVEAAFKEVRERERPWQC